MARFVGPGLPGPHECGHYERVMNNPAWSGRAGVAGRGGIGYVIHLEGGRSGRAWCFERLVRYRPIPETQL